MFERKLPATFQTRDSSLQQWADSGYDPTMVSRLISMIAWAFALSEADARKLRPEDKVWDLYRHYYPRRSGWRGWLDLMRPDELEMETLLADLQRASSAVVAKDLNQSTSLGELVGLLGRQNAGK